MNLIWVMKAKYLSDYKINLVFSDGVQGIADLKDSLDDKVFEPLRDKEYFKTFNKNSWTIEWNCNVDFAPEYLYKLVRQELLNVQF